MRRALAALGAVALLAALSGCVSLPEEGPVTSGPPRAGASPPGTFDYNPEGPALDDEPTAIVNGFIDALRETPLTFTAARSFLTEEASSTWTPSRRTIVYDDGSIDAAVDGDNATVTLGSSVQLDSRGSWLGDPTEGAGLTFDLHLARGGGGWRIDNPPDALIVPRSHFDTRFVRYDLHYFDPGAKILVPEPVYLPAGAQAPSLLVSGLLAGPDPKLRSVERTFFPAGTRLELDVPVENGIADVPLSDELLDTDPGQLDLAMAQLAWTLRQIPGIDKMRVTVDGTPVDGRTGASARSLLGWSAYDPALPTADPDLFALKEGDVVEFGEDESTASTAYRTADARSLGVSLGAEPDDIFLAAVTGNGRRVLTSVLPPLAGTGERSREAYNGNDVLRPAYDSYDHLWLVDRTPSGARILVVDRGQARSLSAPGVTGRDVHAFALSRDGTRLAALIDGKVVMARINRSEGGRPTRLQRAVPVPLEQSTRRAVDLAWTTPSTIGVLVRLGANISQVKFASVDGSYALNAEVTSLEPLFERADTLVSSPVQDAPVLIRAGSGRIYTVSATGHWAPASSLEDIVAPTFPG